MADLTYEQAKALDDSEQRAIQISGKNPDGTNWSGLPTQATVTGGATSAKQDDQIAIETAIQAAVEAVESQTADVATQTTLAAINTRLAGIVSTTSASASSISTPIDAVDVSNASIIALQVQGTFNLTLTFEASNNNTNWFAVQMSRIDNQGGSLVSQQPGSNQTIFTAPVGFRYFRVRVSAYSSGTANLTLVALNNQAIPATTGVSGSINTKANYLQPSAPATATVGTSSAIAVAQNFNRKGLVLTNTSSNIIYLGFGATAVVGSGYVLQPTGTPESRFTMDEYTFTNAAVHAIASGAGSNLAIQEYT